MEAYKSLVKNIEAQMFNIIRAVQAIRNVRIERIFPSVNSDRQSFHVLRNALLATAQEIEDVDPERSEELKAIVKKHEVDFDKVCADAEATAD